MDIESLIKQHDDSNEKLHQAATEFLDAYGRLGGDNPLKHLGIYPSLHSVDLAFNRPGIVAITIETSGRGSTEHDSYYYPIALVNDPTADKVAEHLASLAKAAEEKNTEASARRREYELSEFNRLKAKLGM